MASDMQTIKMTDYESLLRGPNYLSKITPTVTSRGQAVYRANNTPTTIYGVNEQYSEIRGYSVDEGSMFTQTDIQKAAKVCVVGQTIVKNLFPDGENPLGKNIRFGKIPLKIIGILESKGYNSMGMDQDDILLAPYTTVQKRILAINYLQGITAAAISEEYSTQAIEEITEILQINHNIQIGQENDFNVRSQQEIMETMGSVMDMMTILLGCIAGISLLVGGIGIMNIMYVSVTERTREIGLRMSIGAKGIHILMQFLIEAVIISVTGGVLGVLLGVGASCLIPIITGWPVSVQAYSIILSFLVCTLTGVFFGWYPAQKASRLNPIDAIRYE